MNREEKFLDTKHCGVKGKTSTSSGSSNYTTCSDNPIENLNVKNGNLQGSLHSAILAGQVLPHSQEIKPGDSLVYYVPNNDTNNETNYSVNVLDQNLDAISDSNDTFMDCQDLSQSDLSDESTKYLPIESVSKLLEMKLNNHFYANYSTLNKLNCNDETSQFNDSLLIPIKSEIENDRLITIMEETEVTRANNSFLKNKFPLHFKHNSEDASIEIIRECKSYDEISNHNKNSMRRVLFENGKNDLEHNKLDKLKHKREEKCYNLQFHKDKCCVKKERDINENFNTTESFVLWEKFCKGSDKLISRRSYSFSELNSVIESYTGDDEYSTSFKTLDDTYLSEFSFDTNNRNISEKKYLKHRSKSCDSLLREVKHLPHILYDRFLKCLAKEIENIRKQNIVCICKKQDKKSSNKENHEKSSKHNVNTSRIQNRKNVEKNKSSLKISPIKSVTNQIKLSPDILRNSPQDVQRLSPKSLNKTPTTPSKKRGLYSWQKEIVSPVGEYIRGKRQSPFKTSPSKKKL